jgi:hypothetical protein
LVPPEDISSSYSYRACARSLINPDGLICLLSPPTLMEILYITPPFSYTYQCGSTLLTSYLLVYMYSISLQIFSLLMRLILVFSTNFTQHPNWFMKLFPGIYWPSKWKSDNQSSRDVPRTKSPRLLRPAQIISGAMYHMILLLSFGLCSPVLAGYITFSLCANMCCWLVLIGRFLSYYRNITAEAPTSPGRYFIFLFVLILFIFSPTAAQGNENYVLVLNRLNQQLDGVNAYLLVCKWPIILTSSSFASLLCWEMAGDDGGWSNNLWVPIVGVAMMMMIWMWDRLLIKRTIQLDRYSDIVFGSDSANAIEIVVRSSLHYPSPGMDCHDF